MSKENRTAVFDSELNIEAYRFEGIMQKFPNHFHEYYVIGFIEQGQRHLSCRGKEYDIRPGELLLFNPGDNHTCEQIDEGTLDYRCLNISRKTMRDIVMEMAGKEMLPLFGPPVVSGWASIDDLRDVHEMVISETRGLKKEEAFLLLMEELIREFASTEHVADGEADTCVARTCKYLEENYASQITLADLCGVSGLGRYTLIRSFSTEYGVTPVQYLETVRIGKAKEMLRDGASVIDTAFACGFSDQSHLTRFFKKYIGLTPKQYRNIFSREEKNGTKQ